PWPVRAVPKAMRAHLIVASIVFALIIAVCWLNERHGHLQDIDNPAGLLAFSLSFGLVSLLSIWVGLSRLRLATRALHLILATALLSPS
ncbi:MAG: hypothetical protein ACRETN_14020, partial [Nevskiales bacterium]